MWVIKFFGWEQVLEARVEAWRAQELGRLRVIKYLDAVCVYLWAALPVVISIVIFITYVLLGHQLTATKVRTRGGGREDGGRQLGVGRGLSWWLWLGRREEDPWLPFLFQPRGIL